MEGDARARRMEFITPSTDIRMMFSWVHPRQVLEAIRVYTTSFYGSMLYDLYGEEAGMIYRCWNTAVKLVWDVPRELCTYFVDSLLAKDIPSVRTSLLRRYTSYCRGCYGRHEEQHGEECVQHLFRDQLGSFSN